MDKGDEGDVFFGGSLYAPVLAVRLEACALCWSELDLAQAVGVGVFGSQSSGVCFGASEIQSGLDCRKGKFSSLLRPPVAFPALAQGPHSGCAG